MTTGPEKGRRSIRLKGYDYSSSAAYFITVCTVRAGLKPAHTKPVHAGKPAFSHLFGEVIHGEMRLNEYGETVRDVWRGLPAHYPHVVLDAFVTMPNHVHAIVILSTDPEIVGAGFKPAPTTEEVKIVEGTA